VKYIDREGLVGHEREVLVNFSNRKLLGSVYLVAEKEDQGTIAAIKAGPFEWPRRECYYIKRQEVMRVLKEVPLPPTGETLADWLERGRDRLYRDMGMDTRSEVNRFLNLDRRSHDELLIKWLLDLTSHRPRPRTKKPQ
jgi:hypothetical protein